ncbi:MAG: hypothetical protein A2149_03625 [Candidatus Schekmanbacteria bacterium RBG_16_38_11]|uniref:Uncharacterized protein n=1 Tax=Candidatus Schekmanbacteria bacterium RBG_16_38_11 TaxID=1817880 RepID=A0A1F7RXQ2_9BACT|nr:MAG: hypothetical protein A2149_03625 [Candidatus Schekmanbacteria bacterium RBG_16_38_11]
MKIVKMEGIYKTKVNGIKGIVYSNPDRVKYLVKEIKEIDEASCLGPLDRRGFLTPSFKVFTVETNKR